MFIYNYTSKTNIRPDGGPQNDIQITFYRMFTAFTPLLRHFYVTVTSLPMSGPSLEDHWTFTGGSLKDH